MHELCSYKNVMLTLTVLVPSVVSHIKHIINKAVLIRTATEPVGSTERGLCNSNCSRTSKKQSESAVSACNCSDRESVVHPKAGSSASVSKRSMSHEEEMWTHYCGHICTFASGVNNLWITPTLQATLNLIVIQDKLQQQTPTALIKQSKTPKFAHLFLTALKNPGKQFADINEALLDLSTILPNSNEPKIVFCFLDYLLVWLEKCGLHTRVLITKTMTCESCGVSRSCKLNLGRIIELPQPTSPNQTTYFLFQSTFSKHNTTQNCASCDSSTEETIIWNPLDILILHLPEDKGSEPRHTVAASEFVTIFLTKDQKTVYVLSSIICYNSAHHYRAFLINLYYTIQADGHLSVRRGRPQEDLDGKIYLYERLYARDMRYWN